ncbi:alkaline phosphatase [Roseiconus lacunae]|uniref:alkaline phosphatase n=1 Tax=Roseiconus lacunae TaxID=2605694 RepID=UPI001E53F60A|nr:alkaline phosphatase [Roseiconus lacunae]MCD0461127.1 alkaline phosphatase [Roseiconus lacunae]
MNHLYVHCVVRRFLPHDRQSVRSARPTYRNRGFAALIAGVIGIATLASTSNAEEFTSEKSSAESPSASSDTTAAASTSPDVDAMQEMQKRSIQTQKPVYGHWGANPQEFSTWTNHSNRLIPVYTFGMTLNRWRERGSVYHDEAGLKAMDGKLGDGVVNPHATYYDQTDIYSLQKAAVDAGYTNIIVMVFDGMDWQTTRAASIYNTGTIPYQTGRGTGLHFQDDRRTKTDFGLVVTSAAAGGAKWDVDAQVVNSVNGGSKRGYNVQLAGRTPWDERANSEYLLGKDRSLPHIVTDSASSATSLFSGIKTYNGSINVAVDGSQVTPIARELQRDRGFKVGLVTSVPVSHATPAAAYANNVTRKDYQDISRDLVGLPSSAHRNEPLQGVDVLIGGGWGEGKGEDDVQGRNFAKGNPFFHQEDIKSVDLKNGGKYRVVQRNEGQNGREALLAAAQQATDNDERLLGFYGVKGGHLPFSTADGNYDPTLDVKGKERYSEADLIENPDLADMTEAALTVLEKSIDGFWLLVEAGDVDWANHANNLDNSIGAVLKGDAAFKKIMDWVDENNGWDHTVVIVTADHGHYLVIDDPKSIAEAGQ